MPASLRLQNLQAKARERILNGRKFEDEIRIYAGNEEISIEIENDGNRLELEHLAYGCLVIPANKRLSNPYISRNGKEQIWDYVTKRLLPMILPISGGRLDNILVLRYERATLPEVSLLVTSASMGAEQQSFRGLVQREWMNAGKPSWNVDDTLKVAVEADERLEQEGLKNSAEKFRINRKTKQLEYLQRWVKGCKFEWLKKS